MKLTMAIYYSCIFTVQVDCCMHNLDFGAAEDLHVIMWVAVKPKLKV